MINVMELLELLPAEYYWMTKSRRMGLAGQMASVGENRDGYSVLEGSLRDETSCNTCL
jgi:hypothetical protein